MFKAESVMQAMLDKRTQQGILRHLKTSHNSIDFCSNDYLGFSRSLELKDRIFKFSRNLDSISYVGSTGSRLISGNTALVESLENFVATYHGAEAGLLFNSGYDANLGLMSALPQRHDTVIYDAYIHASLRDGVRLSFARSFSFRHNDITHLRERLQKATGNIFVVVESVYSADGDMAPLVEIAHLCEAFDAHLIVDEAHATGVFGNGGKGLVVENELQKKIFARIHTFGKAFGCHGAIVLGSTLLRQFLLNYARSFIYTTALPFHSYVAIKSAYDLMNEDDETPRVLHELISYFKNSIQSVLPLPGATYIPSDAPIQSIIIPGIEKTQNISQILNQRGFDIKALYTPTVPLGKERLRITIHAFNTKDEIKSLISSIKEVLISKV